MTPTISTLIFICAVFAAAAALRILVRASLVLTYFTAELVNAPRRPARAPLRDLKLPTAA